MDILSIFFFKSSLLLQPPPPDSLQTGNRCFHFTNKPYAKLPLYFDNQRVLGVVSLPVDK